MSQTTFSTINDLWDALGDPLDDCDDELDVQAVQEWLAEEYELEFQPNGNVLVTEK